MSHFKAADYVFVICAYKESPYLEACIRSLKRQELPAKILLVTSTPNSHIESLVQKYKLEYHINTGKGGIAEDWNFGLHMAKGRLVTIAHQDDIYEPAFAKTVLEEVNRHSRPLIAFTDYGELRNDTQVAKNLLLHVKRLMLFPMRIRKFQDIRFIRRRILSFGSPICCPSVTFVKENLPEPVFTSGYRSDVDWQAWERLSKYKGSFIYCKEILMFHRIHEESETTAIIANQGRTKEDFDMLCRFWPKPIAGLIGHFYRKGEISNRL